MCEERGEELGRGSVGYMIRGENRTGRATRLAFCTTGIILRRLQESGGRALRECGISHVVVDEVHERGLDSDVLLALLKQLLPVTPGLHLVLMSATMDSARLARYFSDGRGPSPPVLHIPGFTHPVQDVWLPELLGPAFLDLPPTHRMRRALEEDDDDSSSRPTRGGAGPSSSSLDYKLLVQVVRHVCGPDFASRHPGPSQGAVLVFMPGVGEISRLINELQAGVPGVWAVPLHGGLSGKEQALVFREGPPAGFSKKVVVATNVAETSITIPDVTVVIDSARVKESGYDPVTRMACLVEQWASQDSIRQRRGRAGRVQAGMAIHVTLSRQDHDALPEHSLPEVQRTPLEQVVLQLLCMGHEPRPFMAGMLDPPEPMRLAAALATLKEVQAVVTPASSSGSGGEQLTALGRHLAALPCPVRVGKMLVYGAVLGVLQPVLAIASGMLARSPFVSTANMEPERKAAVEAARRRLRGAASRSDHLVLAGRHGGQGVCNGEVLEMTGSSSESTVPL